MKRLNSLKKLFLISLISVSCGKPVDVTQADFLGNNSRFIGPEGGTVEFIESVFSDVEDRIPLVTLDFPTGSVDEDLLITMVRGDFFDFWDLQYDEV